VKILSFVKLDALDPTEFFKDFVEEINLHPLACTELLFTIDVQFKAVKEDSST
jgi:hypothetical protein